MRKKLWDQIKQLFEISEDIIDLFFDIKELFKNRKQFLFFIISLPFTFLFLLLNLQVYLFFLIYYFIVFLIKFVKNKIKIYLYKKSSDMNRIYIKNMSYKINKLKTKNGFIICLEKALIAYPRKRAFHAVYTISKYIYTKKIKLDYTQSILLVLLLAKKFLERVVIKVLTGFPFKVLYCNVRFVEKVFGLAGFNYVDRWAFFTGVVSNVTISLEPPSSINKSRIKFNKKIIIFNKPNLELLRKELNYSLEFYKNCNIFSRKLYFLSGRHIRNYTTGEVTKEHPTTLYESEEDVFGLNQTKAPYIFGVDKNYEDICVETNFEDKGLLKEDIKAKFTPLIVSEKNSILMGRYYANVKAEVIDKYLSAVIFSLNKKCLVSKKILNSKGEVINVFYKENSTAIDYLNKTPKLTTKTDLEILNFLSAEIKEKEKNFEEMINNGFKSGGLEIKKEIKNFDSNLTPEEIQKKLFDIVNRW